MDETFGVVVISIIFFFHEEGKFVGNLLVFMNRRKGRL